MSNQVDAIDEDTRRLVVAVTDFLREQLETRDDFVPEDRDCLEIAIQCLEMAYGLDDTGYVQLRFARPLLDIFTQVTHPVSVRNKLRADAHKDEGNSLMRQNMPAEAEIEYSNAIELDRWNAIYYCNRASSRIEQRHYFDAISDCRQALLLNPDYAKAYARMGQAYALINRPREAARCYRQALQLDPCNERYRNNLRVAENQITRPDAMELLTTMLGSLFGMAPQTTRGRDTNMSFPSSFMIITESHPARTNISRDNQNVPTVGQPAIKSENRIDEDRSSNAFEIIFPLPYGVIDEGSEEQPLQTDQQPQMTDESDAQSRDVIIPESHSSEEYVLCDTGSKEFAMTSIPERNATETREVYQDGNNKNVLSDKDEKELSQKYNIEQLSTKEVRTSVPSQLQPEDKDTQSTVIDKKEPAQLAASDNISQLPRIELNIPSPLSIQKNGRASPMIQKDFVEVKKSDFQQKSQSESDSQKSKIKQDPLISSNNRRLSEGNQVRTIEETAKEDTKCSTVNSSASEVIDKMKEGFKSHLMSSLNGTGALDISSISLSKEKNGATLKDSNDVQKIKKPTEEISNVENKDTSSIQIKGKISDGNNNRKYSADKEKEIEILTKLEKPPTEVAVNIERDETYELTDDHKRIVNELLSQVEEHMTRISENSENNYKDISPIHIKEENKSQNNVKTVKDTNSENSTEKVAGNEIKGSKDVKGKVSTSDPLGTERDMTNDESNDGTSKGNK